MSENNTNVWLPPDSKLAKATGLQGIWVRQVQQQQAWHDWSNLTAEERLALAKDLAMHAVEEVAEMQRMVYRDRRHVLNVRPAPEPYAMAEAGADVVKLVIAQMALHGVGPDLFLQAFNRKTDVVDDQLRGERMKLANETEVLLCDIDGVLADWKAGFTAFAESHGMAVTAADWNGLAIEPLKDLFDATGGYLGLDVIPGSVETLREVKARGTKVVMITARPLTRHKRVYADTVEWFRMHGVPYDHIIFNRDKAEAARTLAPARIIGHIEDRPKHCLEVAALGIRVFRVPSEYNERVDHPNIIPVTGWDEIKGLLLGEARAS